MACDRKCENFKLTQEQLDKLRLEIMNLQDEGYTLQVLQRKVGGIDHGHSDVNSMSLCAIRAITSGDYAIAFWSLLRVCNEERVDVEKILLAMIRNNQAGRS